MAHISLKKRPGDTYAVLAMLLLITTTFVGLSKSSTGSGPKVVNAYIRDSVVYQMSPAVDRTYIFHTSEHLENINEYSNYLLIENDEVPQISEITSRGVYKDYNATNIEFINLDDKEGHLLQGPIVVSIEGGFVDVIAETSQHNYCSLMKATDQLNWPLTCAPNFFRVVIEVQS
ncbi:MAG: hypothetical protein GX350_01465 [Erysipelotrichaceae bacterium]|nr:hypothetical protein [Erysipelotrichaceae bacterium]